MSYPTIAFITLCAIVIVPFFASKKRKDGYYDDQYDPHFQDNFKSWWND